MRERNPIPFVFLRVRPEDADKILQFLGELPAEQFSGSHRALVVSLLRDFVCRPAIRNPTLAITPKDAGTIYQALGKLPAELVETFRAELHNAINEQYLGIKPFTICKCCAQWKGIIEKLLNDLSPQNHRCANNQATRATGIETI